MDECSRARASGHKGLEGGIGRDAADIGHSREGEASADAHKGPARERLEYNYNLWWGCGCEALIGSAAESVETITGRGMEPI